METDGCALSNFTARTEHFANERDFVAQLKVIAKKGGSYSSGEDRVFIRKGSGGHLFKSQYSLKESDYGMKEGDSWLLACQGRAMKEAKEVGSVKGDADRG